MVVFFHEVRARDDGELLYIDRVGYLDCLSLTTVVTDDKHISIVTDWHFGEELPGILLTYVWR